MWPWTPTRTASSRLGSPRHGRDAGIRGGRTRRGRSSGWSRRSASRPRARSTSATRRGCAVRAQASLGEARLRGQGRRSFADLAQAGDRVKTDRRDARKLLSQFTAGQLTEVYAPDPAQEADRELTRCRESTQTDLKRARQRLQQSADPPWVYLPGRETAGQANTASGSGAWCSIGRIFARSSMNTASRSSTVRSGFSRWTSRSNPWPRAMRYREAVEALRCMRGIDTLTAISA